MTEVDLVTGPMLAWLGPGARYPNGHDGVAVPGGGQLWKCLGRQFGTVFLGLPTWVGTDGRARGAWTFALRDPDGFCARYPEWAPLWAVSRHWNAGPGWTAGPGTPPLELAYFS